MDGCGADCEVEVVARVSGERGFRQWSRREMWKGGDTVGLGAFGSPSFGIRRLSLLGERVCRMTTVHTGARAACCGTRGRSWQDMGRAAAGARGAKMVATTGVCSGGATDARTTRRRGGHRGGRGKWAEGGKPCFEYCSQSGF